MERHRSTFKQRLIAFLVCFLLLGAGLFVGAVKMSITGSNQLNPGETTVNRIRDKVLLLNRYPDPGNGDAIARTRGDANRGGNHRSPRFRMVARRGDHGALVHGFGVVRPRAGCCLGPTGLERVTGADTAAGRHHNPTLGSQLARLLAPSPGGMARAVDALFRLRRRQGKLREYTTIHRRPRQDCRDADESLPLWRRALD